MSTATEREAIYAEYCDKVRRYISGKLHNSVEVEDLVSETFLKIYEKYDTFDSTRSSVSTWIYTITRNTVIDYFRTRHVHGELPESLSDSYCMEDDFLHRDSLKTLCDALEELDVRSRDLIILRYYQRMTLKNIAVRMGISYSYVKILHNTALQALRKHLNI